MSWHTPTADFGSSICMKLIRLVKERPSLYKFTKDINLGPRRNRSEINQMWEDVANEVGVTAYDCKRRWKGLKDVYAKIRKKRIQEIALGIEPKKKWLYEDAMSFMQFPFEQNYQQALENFEEVDCEEWKMDYEAEDTADENLDEPTEPSETGKSAQERNSQHDQDEEGIVEYLDLDLEVDAVPDSEDYYSNDSTSKAERRSNDTTEKPQVQTSLLKSNYTQPTEVKPRPKYRPIRPKPSQPNLIARGKTNGMPSIVNLSSLSPLSSFIMTSPPARKDKNFDTVIVTSPPSANLRSHVKAGNASAAETPASPKKNESSGDKTTSVSNKKDSSANKFQEKTIKGGVELFFESMAKTVMSLPMHAQAEIKMEICKVVTMAEIQYSSAQQEQGAKSQRPEPKGRKG